MSKLYKNGLIYRNFSYAKLRTWYANLVKPGYVKPPYKHIVQIGDPILRTESSNVSFDKDSYQVQAIVAHLKHVLKRYNCVGLSAPQIGIPLRIFIMEINKKHTKQFTKEEIKNQHITLIPLIVG